MRRVSLFTFDVSLLAATLVLMVVGILFIYSSGVSFTGAVYSREFLRQVVWAGFGLVVMAVVTVVSYSRFRNLSVYLYVLINLMLLITLFVGRVVNGARSWLGTGDIGVQPSEFAKVIAIVFLASYLSGIGKGVRELPRFLVGALFMLLPMALILLQPDMGTALVFIPIFLFMTYAAGARVRHLVYVAGVGLLTIGLSVLPAYEVWILGREASILAQISDFRLARYLLASLAVISLLAAWGTWGFKRRYFFWILYFSSMLLFSVLGAVVAGKVLKEYQMMRLIIFLNPQVDPQGAGWNIIQSVTAVGSGGFLGKGFLQGTQSHYQFLPQQSTDFIFSILAEEWGFLGAALVFACFVVILLRGIRIMYTARDEFGMYIGAGVVGMIFFHAVVNIGMAMGVMPITGIPLFFLSYGGSSLWTALIGVGLLLNIYLRRYRH